MLEQAPKSRLDQLTDKIRNELEQIPNCEMVKILSGGNYRYIPGRGLQVYLNDPMCGHVMVSVFYNLEGVSQDEFVITNMTTLPYDKTGFGFGGNTVRGILRSLEDLSDLKFIRAVQVQRDSERFWEKLGFEKLGNVTNDFEYKRS